jgi:hypothetical protein
LREAASEIGPDFFTMQPWISKVLRLRGVDMSFKDAYREAKRLKQEFGGEAQGAAPAQAGRTPQGTPAPAAKTQSTRKVDIGELRSRAAQVNPERGVAGADVTEPPPQARSFREAFR